MAPIVCRDGVGLQALSYGCSMSAVAETKHSTFRLREAVRDRLAALAEDEGLPLTGMVTKLVNDEWRRRAKAGTLPPSAPARSKG